MKLQTNIKCYFLLIFLILLLWILNSCFFNTDLWGPGYIVKIKITYNKNEPVKGISQIEELLINEKFIKEGERNNQSTDIRYYKQLKEARIGVLLSFKNSDTMMLDYIILGNRKRGYPEPIRKEIDKIANIIIKELEKTISKGNLDVERERTSIGI